MNNEIGEKYLPIGTVVMLKGGTKRAMITGFCSIAQEDSNKMYDYSGCIYPEGYISSNQVCLFDHSQIEKVYHTGLIDEEEISFKDKLKTLVEQIQINNNSSNNSSSFDNNASVEPVMPDISVAPEVDPMSQPVMDVPVAPEVEPMSQPVMDIPVAPEVDPMSQPVMDISVAPEVEPMSQPVMDIRVAPEVEPMSQTIGTIPTIEDANNSNV